MRMQALKIVTILALFMISAIAVNAGDMAWFDLENCSMCKNMGDNPDLMKNMTWEQHNISNGVISVTMVAKEFKDAYQSCNAKMKAVGEKLMSGEQMEMCGSCNAFGSMMQKGLKYEMVETSAGHLSIITGDSAELIAEIQSWADKNREEMKKYSMAEEK